MSVASQFSFGNAAVLTSGTLPGERGVAAGNTATSFVIYNGNTVATGQFYSGNTTPTSNTRLNYNGDIYATNFVGGNKPRVVTITDGNTVTINGDITDIASQTNTQSAGTLVINAITVSYTKLTLPTNREVENSAEDVTVKKKKKIKT